VDSRPRRLRGVHGRSFPSEYWNRAVFVCEPTARLVHTDWLVPRGSAFVARDGWNLVASTDPWFGPSMRRSARTAPLWILDWYNYIIQHNPTPAGFKTGRGAATKLRSAIKRTDGFTAWCTIRRNHPGWLGLCLRSPRCRRQSWTPKTQPQPPTLGILTA